MSEAMSSEPDVFVKVIGLGGCGCNITDQISASGLGHVKFICANTDEQALKRALPDGVPKR